MQAEDRSNIVELASRLLLRHHVDAWHALGWAWLSRQEDAAFRLFALQDWSRWQELEACVISAMPVCWFADIATLDAMSRILWRRAEVSQERRAWQLRIRASEYRRVTRHAEAIIRGLLITAAVAYLAALAGRDGFTPASRHAPRVDPVCTPKRPPAVLRQGLHSECKRAA